MATLFLTGGNRGIGYYMVKQWLGDGNCAAVLDLDCASLQPLQQQYPGKVLCFAADVTDASAVKEVIDQTIAAFGTVDVAVHNACLCLFRPLEELTSDDYRRVMDVNLLGAVHLAQAVLPHMKQRRAGRLCLTSSGVGVTGFSNISAYAASKGALESLAKCLRLECRPYGVGVHLLHPPLTDTESSSPLPVPREFRAKAEKVGAGLARRLGQRRFVITAGAGDTLSVAMSYLFPLQMGALLDKMTARAAGNSQLV